MVLYYCIDAMFYEPIASGLFLRDHAISPRIYVTWIPHIDTTRHGCGICTGSSHKIPDTLARWGGWRTKKKEEEKERETWTKSCCCCCDSYRPNNRFVLGFCCLRRVLLFTRQGSLPLSLFGLGLKSGLGHFKACISHINPLPWSTAHINF